MRKRRLNISTHQNKPQSRNYELESRYHNNKVDKNKLIYMCAVALCVCLGMYALAAVTFFHCTWIQRELIYVNRINIPFFVNLSNPSEFGLHMAENFYLKHKNNSRIGVWYIPPGKYITSKESINNTFLLLNDGTPIVLYLHGNTGARGTSARVGLYRYLSYEKNYHVVTFDYRGFGDSDGYPNETNIMEDGLLVWQWIKLHAPDGKIYLWGHSLGSGVATHLTVYLQSIDTGPAAILLDAPFTNIHDAAYHHPLGIPFWPLGKNYFLSIRENHSSIDRISQISCPIMIMHGRSDIIIPFHIGKKLYDAAIITNSLSKVTFVDCGHTDHKYNYHSDELKKALDVFIQ